MFLMRTEAAMTWIAPALLGAVLGLLVYLGIDPPVGTGVLAAIFALIGMVVSSLVAYGFRRFLLPRNEEDIEES
jgi:hypothetical protein